MAIAISKDEGVTLKINSDSQGRPLKAMPDTLFDQSMMKQCLEELKYAATHMTSHLRSFVKMNKVYNAPLKPHARVEDLEVNYSTFKPFKMLPRSHFVGDNAGFCRLLKVVGDMATSRQLQGRYFVVNVDEAIYKKGVKVCGGLVVEFVLKEESSSFT